MIELLPTVLVDGLCFPECPRWRTDRLWFSDMRGTRFVHTVGLSGHVERVVNVPQRPGGLGWLADGSLLAVSADDNRLMRLIGGELVLAADMSQYQGGPANDMVVDGSGRAYVGNQGSDLLAGEPLTPTAILRIDAATGTCHVAADDVITPNGMAITQDGSRFIVAESRANRLTAFVVGADGTLGNRELFADLGEMPDGICLDTLGAVWVALPRAHVVLRVLASGEITHKVSTGELHARACMLGGPNRRTLFVCAGASLDPDSRTGVIATVEVTVPGAGWP
jgi:sugar lactone lactonase YvrE